MHLARNPASCIFLKSFLLSNINVKLKETVKDLGVDLNDFDSVINLNSSKGPISLSSLISEQKAI